MARTNTKECICKGCENKSLCYYVEVNQIVGSFKGYYCFDCCFDMGFEFEYKNKENGTYRR